MTSKKCQRERLKMKSSKQSNPLLHKTASKVIILGMPFIIWSSRHTFSHGVVAAKRKQNRKSTCMCNFDILSRGDPKCVKTNFRLMNQVSWTALFIKIIMVYDLQMMP